MAASRASRELFTEGVRAVLQTWPVLQVSPGTGSSARSGTEPGLCGGGRASDGTAGTSWLMLTAAVW